jgi:hypothetical protein
MTDVHEQAQTALLDLNCVHPDTAITGLQAVLERIGSDSPDAAVFKRAIDRLEEIACEISDVETMLAEVDFSFGRIKT